MTYKSVNAFVYLLVVSITLFLAPSSSFAGFLNQALHKAEGSVANKINNISQDIGSTQQASGKDQGSSDNGGKSPAKTTVGLTSPADKITVLSGTTYVTHDVKKTAEPIPAVYPGISLDILGIKPGMSVEAVKRILVSHYKSAPRAISGNVSITYKTLSISSQPFVSELEENNNLTDIIDVWFGSPATGNTVIGIYRRLQFNDENTAPKISQLVTALDKKYGPETNIGPNPMGKFRWFFGKHGLIKSCANGSCPNTTLDPMLTDPFAASAGNPYGGSSASLDPAHYYPRVAADVAPLLGDQSRAAWLAVSLNDPTDGLLSVEEGRKQLHAAGVVDYKKIVKPENTPQL